MNCFLWSVLRYFPNILLLSQTNLIRVQCAHHCLHSNSRCMFICRKQSLLLDEGANIFVVVLIVTSFPIFLVHLCTLMQTRFVNI